MHRTSKELLFSITAMLSLGGAAHADVILDWNRIGSDVLQNNVELQNPGMASRSMAMLNLAMYDAFKMTAPAGTMYYDYGHGNSSPGYVSMSRNAAAAQAAFTVLSEIYPDQQSLLDTNLSASLANVSDGPAKTDAIALGEMIGRSIVDRRSGDGYDAMSQYLPTMEAGRWQPDPLNPDQQAWGPEWGDVRPFSLFSNRQFMPLPMPDLTSQAYADAFNEVKQLGSVDSAARTAEQTEIGLFWAYDRVGMGTPMRMYNSILRTIAEQEGNTPEQNAALFAKATVAMADAGIVAWNSKFEYDFWRPVTGIRDANLDGNPLTEADPDWTPLGAPGGDEANFTPPFPTYVSGHATFGGALFTAIEAFYGTDDISFSLESEELPGIIRSFDTLSEAMAENGRSRVYLGIHWNFDDTVARALGADVAAFVMSEPFVAAVPEPSSICLILAALLGGTAARLRRHAG
ncbi:MAG: vanadium-dependent haloperoxidase [Planctomycetota bacterium]